MCMGEHVNDTAGHFTTRCPLGWADISFLSAMRSEFNVKAAIKLPQGKASPHPRNQ